MNKAFLLMVLTIFLLLIIGCVSLSQKANDQNIKIVTSPLMVDGMQNVHAYTTDGSGYSINEMGIVAANNAAKEGWSDITILVRYIASAGGVFVSGVFIPANIYEISYWK